MAEKPIRDALIQALDAYLRQDETAGDTDNNVYRRGQSAMSQALSAPPPAGAQQAPSQKQLDYAAHDGWWNEIKGDEFFDLTTRNQSAAAYAKGREDERALAAPAAAEERAGEECGSPAAGAEALLTALRKQPDAEEHYNDWLRKNAYPGNRQRMLAFEYGFRAAWKLAGYTAAKHLAATPAPEAAPSAKEGEALTDGQLIELADECGASTLSKNMAGETLIKFRIDELREFIALKGLTPAGGDS